MGCGSWRRQKPYTEEQQKAFHEAELFRAKLIAEVRTVRESSAGSRRSMGDEQDAETRLSVKSEKERLSQKIGIPRGRASNQSCRSSAKKSLVDAEAPPPITRLNSAASCASIRSGSNRGSHARPLVLQSHVSRTSLVGSELVEANGLTVTLPGKVGCDDDKVVFENSHNILRTRKVHKNQWRAQKLRAQRLLRDRQGRPKASRESVIHGSRDTSTQLTSDEKKVALKVLQNHFLFGSLHNEHEVLVEQMLHLDNSKGDTICVKGQKGDACYIVISGLCSVLGDASQDQQTELTAGVDPDNFGGAPVVAQLSAGTLFGELALLYDVPRTATIVCSSPRAVLGMISGHSFRESLSKAKERTLSETLGFLSNHSVFSKLSLDEKMMLANTMHSQVFGPGVALIGEGQSKTVDWMFLLQEGTVEVTDQYKNRKVLGEGATISGQKMPYGEQVVFAKALTNVRCLAIGKRVVDRLFGNIGEVLRQSTIRCFLAAVPFFRELTEKQQHQVASLFQNQQVRKGDIIVSPMADPQLVLVLEGEVCVMSELDSAPHRTCSGRIFAEPGDFDKILNGAGKAFLMDKGASESVPEWTTQSQSETKSGEANLRVLRTLQRGDVFGDETFQADGVTIHALVANTDAKVCRAAYDEVCQALRGCAEKTLAIDEILQRNRMKKRLQGMFPFCALYEEMLDMILEAFEKTDHAPGAVIMKPHTETESFSLIVEGEAICRALLPQDSADTGSPQLGPPEPMVCWTTFGMRQLLLGTPADAEVVAAASSCCVMTLSQAGFAKVTGVLFRELQTKLMHQELELCRQSFTFIGRLGAGQFGIVNKVAVDGLIGSYALKRMNKETITELEQNASIMLEREILADCCHPLIVRMVASFQDIENVYILMENLEGGDLFTAIRSIGVLNEEHVLFFGASIVLAVEYIHSRGIIYRDLKPENVMLDGEGFVKMVDFGACSKKPRTYTFIGTPEYLAPEVVLGNCYGKAVDWWSTGVILYEMICGPLPFGENSNDPLETFREVLEKEVYVPPKVPAEGADILQSLLERQPEQRLGSSSFHLKNEVRVHPFFEGLQWDAILERTTVPPFNPAYVEPEADYTPEESETEAKGFLSEMEPEEREEAADSMWTTFGSLLHRSKNM